MRNWLARLMLIGLLLWLSPAPESRSENGGDETAVDEETAAQEFLDQAIDWYEVFPDAEAASGLRSLVVLRWRNAVRVNTGTALLAIWIEQGRPEAMATIFRHQSNICHEFGSLSRSKEIIVRDQTGVRWFPEKVGVEFRDVPDAPVPAEKPAERLRQMKSLARGFTARLTAPAVGDGSAEVLRLLPRPLYRYDLEDAKSTMPLLRDGGMFAFVMGTDPEVILLFEAVERDGKAVWQFALARATIYAVEAARGDEVIWSVESGPNPMDVKQIFRPIPQ